MRMLPVRRLFLVCVAVWAGLLLPWAVQAQE